MASRNVDVAVRVDGWRELRRDLKAVDRNAPRELNKAAKRVGQKVADRAQQTADLQAEAIKRAKEAKEREILAKESRVRQEKLDSERRSFVQGLVGKPKPKKAPSFEGR